MNTISALRPTPSLGEPATVTSLAANPPNGGHKRATSAVAATQMTSAVQQSGDSSALLAQASHPSDNSLARIEAAQRAYMMTLRAAGLNPLANPVP